MDLTRRISGMLYYLCYSAVGNIGDTHGCNIVIPAKAGTQAAWVPAFAGMTEDWQVLCRPYSRLMSNPWLASP
jgi:hypothetical protein